MPARPSGSSALRCGLLLGLVVGPAQYAAAQPELSTFLDVVTFTRQKQAHMTSLYDDAVGTPAIGDYAIEHSVSLNLVDDGPDFSFTWTDPVGFNFRGLIPALSISYRAVNTFNTFRQTISPVIGNITLTRQSDGAEFSGTASFYRPFASPLDPLIRTGRRLYSTVSDTVGGGPFTPFASDPPQITAIEFFSELTPLGPDLYEYKYSVVNHTSSPIPFTWEPLGLSGVVPPDTTADADPMENVFVYSFTSHLPGVETDALATSELPIGSMTAIANVIVPLPEPASAMCALPAAGMLGARRRRRSS